MSANESGREPGAEAPLDGVPNEAVADASMRFTGEKRTEPRISSSNRH